MLFDPRRHESLAATPGTRIRARLDRAIRRRRASRVFARTPVADAPARRGQRHRRHAMPDALLRRRRRDLDTRPTCPRRRHHTDDRLRTRGRRSGSAQHHPDQAVGARHRRPADGQLGHSPAAISPRRRSRRQADGRRSCRRARHWNRCQFRSPVAGIAVGRTRDDARGADDARMDGRGALGRIVPRRRKRSVANAPSHHRGALPHVDAGSLGAKAKDDRRGSRLRRQRERADPRPRAAAGRRKVAMGGRHRRDSARHCAAGRPARQLDTRSAVGLVAAQDSSCSGVTVRPAW